MAVSAGTPRRPVAATFPPIPLHRRLYGFGSIYGKTIRDSRLAFIIAAGLLGALPLVFGAAIGTVFPTREARDDISSLIGAMPASMVNLFGKPVGLGTLGGYMSWKYGAIFVLGSALWSITALSGTLAAEARRGSLDFVAVTAFGKRRIAIEKVAAHVTVLTLAMAVLAVSCAVGSTFGDASLGDSISLLSGVAFALWVGFIALFFGGLAFALSPVLGRAGSAGVAVIVMMVLWVANGLDVLGPVASLSPFRWTADHIGLVGQYDWAPLALVGIVSFVFLAIGVGLFARRDLGVTAGLSLPGLPASILGVHGPIARAFGEELPRALSWGIGLGLFGAVLGSLVGPFADEVAKDPGLIKTFGSIFPGIDFTTAGGWLQLYAELFFIAAGFAGATFVAKWASDENEGRLEELLASPMSRARWVLAGGAAAILATVVMTVMFALGTGLGAAVGGGTAGDATLGSVSLGLYAVAIVGVGFAVGGLWRTSLAAEIAALVVVATYLIDLVVPALGLPDWVHQLALTAHFGQPMLGQWDPVGVVASIAIAAVGIVLGAWGMSRRDVGR